MINIVLAEDHKIVRQGLTSLLNKEKDFEVVAEASDGRKTVDLVVEFEPDILVLDWMLPGLNGLEVLRRVKSTGLQTVVVILSMHADESYVRSAFKEGAKGYVLKESSAAHLVEAVRTALSGKTYLCPPISEAMMADYSERIDTGKLDPYQTLTSREREILQLVAEGFTSQQIANELKISPRTVETHRANVMQKLKLDSVSDLTRYALRKGLIPLE